MLENNRRAGPRHKAGVLAALMTNENKFICFGAVRDLSAGGAKLELIKEIELPKTLVMVFSSKFGPRRNCSVVWHTRDEVGLRFIPAKEKEKISR
jgi:PilZ domain